MVNSSYGQTFIDDLGDREFEIGYKSFLLKDYSRNYDLNQTGKTYRPIQVNIWYPYAEKSVDSHPHMLISNYLIVGSDVTKALNDFTHLEKQNILDKERLRIGNLTTSHNQIDSLMNIRSASILNVSSIQKPFPLVIFNPSTLKNSVSNVRFCEYLASQGYIVASHASFGINSILMTTNYQDLDNQTRDSEYILNSGMDISQIGMIGHSRGTMASVLLASRNKNVNSVVSLDRSEEQWKELIINAPSFEISNFQTPYFRLALSDNIEFGFYNVLQNDKIQIEFTDPLLRHFSFVSRYANANIKKESYYKMICNMVLDYFNRTLKTERSITEVIPFEMIEKHKSSKINISFAKKADFPNKDKFLDLIISGKIDDAIKIINASKNKLSYKYLIEIGEHILWTGNFPKESEKYFLNLIENFPEFYHGYEMLGHVYS